MSQEQNRGLSTPDSRLFLPLVNFFLAVHGELKYTAHIAGDDAAQQLIT